MFSYCRFNLDSTEFYIITAYYLIDSIPYDLLLSSVVFEVLKISLTGAVFDRKFIIPRALS